MVFLQEPGFVGGRHTPGIGIFWQHRCDGFHRSPEKELGQFAAAGLDVDLCCLARIGLGEVHALPDANLSTPGDHCSLGIGGADLSFARFPLEEVGDLQEKFTGDRRSLYGCCVGGDHGLCLCFQADLYPTSNTYPGFKLDLPEH